MWKSEINVESGNRWKVAGGRGEWAGGASRTGATAGAPCTELKFSLALLASCMLLIMMMLA